MPTIANESSDSKVSTAADVVQALLAPATFWQPDGTRAGAKRSRVVIPAALRG
ncbi:hypothetical protein [Amycolatopsis sp. cmx-4-83]|uniref:hypothetical protein n=1 Tax=Amycolatopsis sp. cmx-4-83 TaxID=2790940 RepID=UPI00397E5579